MSDSDVTETKPNKAEIKKPSKLEQAAAELENAAAILDGVTGKRQKTAGMIAADLRQTAARLLTL